MSLSIKPTLVTRKPLSGVTLDTVPISEFLNILLVQLRCLCKRMGTRAGMSSLLFTPYMYGYPYR